MGSSVSKQSGRVLTKQVENLNVKRGKVDPLLEFRAQVKSGNVSPKPQTTKVLNQGKPKGFKDGMDPDFAGRAISLGVVNLQESQLKIDLNNLAVATLNKRQEFENMEKAIKQQTHNKTMIDPRTISVILEDLEAGVPKERVTQNYQLHPEFLDRLGYPTIKVARTRDSKKTIDDAEIQQQQNRRRDRDDNEFQKQLDRLL